MTKLKYTTIKIYLKPFKMLLIYSPYYQIKMLYFQYREWKNRVHQLTVILHAWLWSLDRSDRVTNSCTQQA